MLLTGRFFSTISTALIKRSFLKTGIVLADTHMKIDIPEIDRDKTTFINDGI